MLDYGSTLQERPVSERIEKGLDGRFRFNPICELLRASGENTMQECVMQVQAASAPQITYACGYPYIAPI